MQINKYLIGGGIVLCSTFLAAISQVLLKISARKEYETRLREYLNPYVIIAYGIFALTTVLSVLAVRFIPMSLSAALGASGQVFIPLLCHFVLKERITRRKMLGMAVIVAGIVVFSI